MSRISIRKHGLRRWWDGGDGPRDLWWRILHRPWFPYPLRAAKLSLDLRLGIWWVPSWRYHKNLTEFARCQGETIWWVRWLCFQISYARWL